MGLGLRDKARKSLDFGIDSKFPSDIGSVSLWRRKETGNPTDVRAPTVGHRERGRVESARAGRPGCWAEGGEAGPR